MYSERSVRGGEVMRKGGGGGGGGGGDRKKSRLSPPACLSLREIGYITGAVEAATAPVPEDPLPADVTRMQSRGGALTHLSL